MPWANSSWLACFIQLYDCQCLWLKGQGQLVSYSSIPAHTFGQKVKVGWFHTAVGLLMPMVKMSRSASLI